jgi:hypothetical protein
VTAVRNVNTLIDDLDLQVVCFDEYGKGRRRGEGRGDWVGRSGGAGVHCLIKQEAGYVSLAAVPPLGRLHEDLQR